MYPLKFKPAFKFYPYGGRRFADILEMEGVPRDRDVAEAWLLSDRPDAPSLVANGPLAGQTLRDVLNGHGAQLVGEEIRAKYGDYFPLLLKFLDCDKRLPAHLHPDDETAKRLNMQDTGKTEAWHIVRADPGAFAYVGARPGLTPQIFMDAINKGDAYDAVMNRIETRSDETYFVPPGRVHGLDAGNLAFEVQQNSDAGLGWDWAGFVEAGVVSSQDAANHKTLVPQIALYEDGQQEQTVPVMLQEKSAERTICCACRYFVLERWRIVSQGGPAHFWFGDREARFNAFTLLSGAATFVGGTHDLTPGAKPGEEKAEVFARRGETVLVPAGCNVEVRASGMSGGGEVEMLRCYVPDLARDIVAPLREHGISDAHIAGLGSYGRGNDLLSLLGLPPTWGTLSPQERAQLVARGLAATNEES